MRESMGATWLFGIVVLFIVLFSGFMAYSISYTKAFKTKNEILNYIEQAEGFTIAANMDSKIPVDRLTEDELENSSAVDAKVYKLIRNFGYNSQVSDCTGYGDWVYGGYCIEKKCLNDVTDKTSNPMVVYKVTTFISLKIPVIDVTMKLPITGETKTMYYDNEASPGGASCDPTY